MSQTHQILRHLKKGRTITALEALEKFGCLRLAARINDLKNDGHSISTAMVARGDKRVARYQLAKGE